MKKYLTVIRHSGQNRQHPFEQSLNKIASRRTFVSYLFLSRWSFFPGTAARDGVDLSLQELHQMGICICIRVWHAISLYFITSSLLQSARFLCAFSFLDPCYPVLFLALFSSSGDLLNLCFGPQFDRL